MDVYGSKHDNKDKNILLLKIRNYLAAFDYHQGGNTFQNISNDKLIEYLNRYITENPEKETYNLDIEVISSYICRNIKQ